MAEKGWRHDTNFCDTDDYKWPLHIKDVTKFRWHTIIIWLEGEDRALARQLEEQVKWFVDADFLDNKVKIRNRRKKA